MRLSAKSVVVLGGGTGGLVAATRLRRMLDPEHRITIIDRSPYYTFEPSLTWVMAGRRTLPRITRDLRKLRKKGINVHTAEITAIDLEARRVTYGKSEIEFDYLVIALGAEYSAAEVPGLNRAWTFYHGDGAEGMREELESFAGGRVVCAVPQLPYKCPTAFYEGVLLLDAHFRRRKLRGGITIEVYTPEAAPLPEAGPHVGERILELLRSRDIAFTGGVEVKSVNHEKKLLNLAGGEPVPFDMLVATPVHNLPLVLRDTGLAGADGWIAVDRETLATSVRGVYAIGDCASVPIATGKLPKAAVFAHGEAEVVARNIRAEVQGTEPIWAFGGQGAYFLDTGEGKGAYIVANYFKDPAEVDFRGPSRLYYWAKIGVERVWLWRWF
jgi:sulfide:quinone oxidoreductase